MCMLKKDDNEVKNYREAKEEDNIKIGLTTNANAFEKETKLE